MSLERSLSSDQVARAAHTASEVHAVEARPPSVLFFSTGVAPSWEQAESQRLAARLMQSEKWRFETLSLKRVSPFRSNAYCFPAGLRAAAALSRRLRRMIPRYRGLHIVACPYSPLAWQLALPLVLSRFYGVPAIVDLRFGVSEDAVLSPGRVTRKVLGLARAILVGHESPAVRLSHLGLPASVAPPAIDEERFIPQAIERVQPRILARLPASGPDDADRTALKVLMKAFQLVKHKYPRTELRVLCDHDSPLAGQSDQAQGVSIEMAVSDERVVEAYRWADVFVNPAILSAPLIALAHALACGLPVVSTRGGGAAELIQAEETGLLIRSGQPGELADRIIELVEKPDLVKEMSLAAVRRGRTLQSRTQADNWLRLYRRILAV